MASARLFRVILPVNDIATSAAFYSALLDDTGMRVSPGRHYFDCGGVVLALYEPRADGDNRTPRPNWDHVYLAVNDLPAVFERARKTGGVSTDVGDGGLKMGEIARRPWGEVSFYMRDPFGNPLCFVDSSTLFTRPPS
jgi:catechol 2,3-dioxygenase-like lactoylglutathione lyase family enzyme